MPGICMHMQWTPEDKNFRFQVHNLRRRQQAAVVHSTSGAELSRADSRVSRLGGCLRLLGPGTQDYLRVLTPQITLMPHEASKLGHMHAECNRAHVTPTTPANVTTNNTCVGSRVSSPGRY